MFRITKSKPLEYLSHQFLQKCSASGTPKGKAKMKAGQQLKRSKITTKKGSSPAKGAKAHAPDEKQRLYDQCLNAPTPVRFLTPMIMGTPGMDLISLGLVDADKIPKYELTAEDGKRLAKECSRVLMRRHRARQAAESTLLRLKKEAIEALPEDLKKAALVPDLTPFPVNRFMATLTPPIEGYMEKVREATRRSSGNEKMR